MPPRRAPWRDLFQTHLRQNSSTEFNLATVALDEQNRPVPRTRTCGFRGFFPEPELHCSAISALESHEEGQNPTVYESDMISFTTDIRMEKVGQIASSGNVVEAVFWLKDAANQWRVKGEAFVIGDPEEGRREEEARKEIQKGMRVRGDNDGNWTWERQVTTYFANHSPVMRGSFKNPPPGQPKLQVPTDPNLKLGQKVDNLHDPVARSNFRVVVIRPDEVERLDLTSYENPLRWNWTLAKRYGDGGEWVETELWP